MKDPYAVLGLSSAADPEKLKAKYNELHAIYSEQRFKSGEEGNEGARKLQELEEAWVVISANIDRAEKTEAFNGDYGNIDALIRQGKYNEAQDLLDAIKDRNAEWHYMQAIVFYKREWLTESKTQLEMALRDEPNNSKYRASLEKLNIAMQGGVQPNANRANTSTNADPQAGNGNNVPPYYDRGTPQQPSDDMSNCLSSCCCAYCLADCLCSSMRCC